MSFKIVTLLALFAVLLGCAFAHSEVATGSSIKLHVYDSSSIWWIAVDPRDDGDQTANIELREASSSLWVEMIPNPAWGYWQLPCTSGRGFQLPLSFRLTNVNGTQVTLDSVLTGISGSLLDTGSNWGNSDPTQAPTTVPTGAPTTVPTDAPTQRPTERPTQRPTQEPTERPTQRPTERPTQRPTERPTQRPTQEPTDRPTQRPTERPTQAPTERPTQAPTTRPTQAPTERPTQAPTTRPTQAPTERPTQAPTQRPTSAPTQRPTTAPTTAPTTRPTTAPTNPPASGDLCALTPTSSEPIKILVPLYVYPGSAWDQVVTAANSGVKIIAIINPNSGPSSSGPDSTYKTYMQKLTNAGVEMVGYVHTTYGDRSMTDVNNEVDIYASKYTGVTGIFLDEASASSSDISYYTQVYNHIMSKSGFKHSILNPGTQPDQGYVAISTNIVIFEDAGSKLSSGRFASWVKCAPNASQKAGYKYKFSGIAHTTAQGSMASVISTMQNSGMGLVYVTDGAGGCCTYNTLASYFTAEASSVKALN